MAFVGGAMVSGFGANGFVGDTVCRKRSGTCRLQGAAVVRMELDRANEGGGARRNSDSSTRAQKKLQSEFQRTVRSRYRRMAGQLNRLVKEEKFLEAAKIRDDMKSIEESDPLLKYGQLDSQLKELEKEENFTECIKVRNEMTQLREQIPHLNLQGLWKGNMGNLIFRYKGLNLVALKADTDGNSKKNQVVFEADFSFRSLTYPQADPKLDMILKLIPGPKPELVFHGRFASLEGAQSRDLQGYFVIFDRFICAFVLPSLASLIILQRQDSTLPNKSSSGRPSLDGENGGSLPTNV